LTLGFIINFPDMQYHN